MVKGSWEFRGLVWNSVDRQKSYQLKKFGILSNLQALKLYNDNLQV